MAAPKVRCFEGLSPTTVSQLIPVARLAYQGTLKDQLIFHDVPETIETLGMQSVQGCRQGYKVQRLGGGDGAGHKGMGEEGGTPPVQPWGIGEGCSLPHGGLGYRPGAKAFWLKRTPKPIQKHTLHVPKGVNPHPFFHALCKVSCLYNIEDSIGIQIVVCMSRTIHWLINKFQLIQSFQRNFQLEYN